MFYTYVLYSKNYDRFYTGHCSDIKARLERHNRQMVPSTKAYVPWTLVYHEEFQLKSEAMKREQEIKNKKSANYISSLIQRTGRHVPN